MTHKLMTLFGAATFLAAGPALGSDVAEISVNFSVPSEGLEIKEVVELVAGQDVAELELESEDGTAYRLRLTVDDEAHEAHAAIYHVKEGFFGRTRSILLDEHTLELNSGEASRVQISTQWGIKDSATFYIGLTPDADAFVDCKE